MTLAGSPASWALGAGLLFASAVHLDLAITHAPTAFALLSLVAGVSQAALGVAAFLRPTAWAWRASVLVSLVLVQLYALNVTTGLPPLIAHTHLPGTHLVLGLTLANPNAIDLQGLVAQTGQLLAIACGALLLSRSSRRTISRTI
jgi:hypothetical protein